MNGGIRVDHKIEIDLNGTGTLVDVTTYVDQSVGLKYVTGRSDWTQPEPTPGVLTFTLDNLSGRFTPGNTIAASGGTYTVGMRPGLTVKWTVTGDSTGAYTAPLPVRYFVTGTPELTWNGDSGGGGSVVTVSCADSLAKLAAQTLKSMLAEHILAAAPIAYYPLTESGTAVTGAADVSGWGQPSMIPSIDDDSVAANNLQWGSATGPPTDGHGSLQLRSGDVYVPAVISPAAPAKTVDATGALAIQGISDGDNNLSGPLGVPYGTYGVNTGQTFQDATYPGDRIMGVSFWFTINDAYGPTFTAANLTDGPYVSLLHLDNQGSTPEWASGIDVVWRVPDRKILLFPNGGDVPLTITGAASPTSLHHLAFTIRSAPSTGSIVVQAYLDGVAQTSDTSTTYWLPSYMGVRGLKCGWFSDSLSNEVYENFTAYNSPGSLGTAAARVYALSGGISHISVHGAPIVYVGDAVHTTAARWRSTASGLSEWPIDAWLIGSGKLVSDHARDRVRRLAVYTSDPMLTVSDFKPFSGTGQPFLLGIQNTEGKSLLSVLCDALRAEDAILACLGVYAGGVYNDTVVPLYLSRLRARSPVFAIDVDADCCSAPSMAFDSSGAVTQVTVNGVGCIAVYEDQAAALTMPARSVTMDSALSNPGDALALAQYRQSLGAPTRITPSKITMDLKTAKASTLASTLFNAFGNMRTYVGSTVNITNLPAAVLGAGFTTALCLIVGITETYDLNKSTWELQVVPQGGDDFYDSVGRFEPDQVVFGGGEFAPSTGPGGFIAGHTSLWYLSDKTKPEFALTTNASAYPFYIRCEQEVFKVNSAPSSSGIAGSYFWQIVSVTPGQLGTAQASHAGGSGAQYLQIVDSNNTPAGNPYLGF